MSQPPAKDGSNAAQATGWQNLPWSSAVLLDKDEGFVRFWSGDHEVTDIGNVAGRAEEVKTRKHGVMVLTSRKLVFLEERGVFTKSYHVDVGIALENVEGISMGGMWMKYVSVGGSSGENVYHLEGVNQVTFDSFRQAIYGQIELRKQEIENERRRDSVELVLDFSFLRDYMSKGGLSLQALKCPQCKAPLTLPETGNIVKCGYCGSTVYAQDIMDRVKQLIG